MAGRRSFERLVTRLVYRDAAEAYGVVVLAVTFAMVWIERAWRPAEIRAAVAGAEPQARGLVLGATLAAYLLATRSVVALLLASERLAYLRHLPVSRGRWRRLQCAHLVLINAPWIGVVAYGLAEPGSLAGWERGLVGSAWVSLTLAAQVGSIAVGSGPWRLLSWLGASALACAAVVLSGSGGAAEGLSSAAWLGIIAASTAYLWRHLGAPPPERDGLRRGLLSRLWWLRRGGLRGAARSTGSSAALVRLQIWALLRRDPQRLRRRLWIGLAGVLIAAAATTAAARVGEAVDPWLVRLTLICGCMVGAEVVVLARRLLDRDRWYLDALPLRPRAELLAGLSIALLGGAPSALGIGAVLVGIGGAAPLPVLVELLSVLLLAALVMVWTGLRAEARRRLHGRLSLLPAAVAVLAFALLQLSGAPLTLLPLIAGGFFFAFREIGPATRVRRRLETSRRDDDHGAGL